jgi:hypothetical protein
VQQLDGDRAAEPEVVTRADLGHRSSTDHRSEPVPTVDHVT